MIMRAAARTAARSSSVRALDVAASARSSAALNSIGLAQAP